MRRVRKQPQAQARPRRRTGADARDREAVDEEVATPEVEALLAAVRRSAPGPGGANEEAALAAYREARDAGAHALPERWWQARRRDDWRPSRRRRGALPARAAFASVAATVTLGGVALAAGTGAIPAPFGIGGGGSVGPSAASTAARTGAPPTPGAARESAAEGTVRLPSTGVTRSGSARPTRAQDDVAYCVAYLASNGRSLSGRGAASERLTAEAADAGLTVEAYCEDVVAAEERQPGAGTDGKGSTKAPKASKPPKKPGTAPKAPPEHPPAKPDDNAPGGSAANPTDRTDPAKPADKDEPGNGNGRRPAGKGATQGKGGN
ncbi:hypothetical protein [Streptomyces flavidovirens]|uniref:hypothetical protein n=1 Tax=Streptomyces flavidovirens TaxID=67298 RepID=UPI0003F779D1|nr:hypothetical protein [Streptomyces flavidovirens]